MDKLSNISKIRLQIIISFLCFNEKHLNDCGSIISILKAIRDGTIPKSIPLIIDAKYKQFEKSENQNILAYINGSRVKAICAMILSQLCKLEISNDTLDSILICLNICSDKMEATDSIIQTLYNKTMMFGNNDGMRLITKWLLLSDKEWNKLTIDQKTIIVVK